MLSLSKLIWSTNYGNHIKIDLQFKSFNLDTVHFPTAIYHVKTIFSPIFDVKNARKNNLHNHESTAQK